MNKIKFFILVIFPVLLSNCVNDPEPDVKTMPVILKTDTNYSDDTFKNFFPEQNSLERIQKAYSNNYSAEIKTQIVEYIRSEVQQFGEDYSALDKLLHSTGCTDYNEYVLPTYIEKAKFNSKDAWVLQVTNGLGEPKFEHFKCFAIDASTSDTLYYLGCK